MLLGPRGKARPARAPGPRAPSPPLGRGHHRQGRVIRVRAVVGLGPLRCRPRVSNLQPHLYLCPLKAANPTWAGGPPLLPLRKGPLSTPTPLRPHHRSTPFSSPQLQGVALKTALNTLVVGSDKPRATVGAFKGLPRSSQQRGLRWRGPGLGSALPASAGTRGIQVSAAPAWAPWGGASSSHRGLGEGPAGGEGCWAKLSYLEWWMQKGSLS